MVLLYNTSRSNRMPPDIQKLLQELKQGLIRLYGERLKGVYLYGSYARGDFEEGSDLDVLVVLDDFERAPVELDRTSDLFCDLSLIYEVTVSLMFMREKDWLTADKPLLRNVRVEGMPV
jgi:uncharacterized protein